MTPPSVLTIAAHDPVGGAGLAADVTTFASLGVHGFVAVTAVTAQRSQRVDSVMPVPASLLAAQLDSLLADFRPTAVKVGLVVDAAQIEVIAARVADGRLPRPIVDPVMVDGRGIRFVSDEIEQAARARLFPRTAVLTPNRAEAELLGPGEAELASLGADLVVVTGGAGDGTDVMIRSDGSTIELSGPWVDTPNVRGSGCTFAAAVAAYSAAELPMEDAVASAKAFVTERLHVSAGWSLGPPGSAGPVSHLAQGM